MRKRNWGTIRTLIVDPLLPLSKTTLTWDKTMTLTSKLIRLASQNPALKPHIAAILKEASMSEPDFWKLIEPYGWGTKTTDYKAIKKSLMGKLSPDEADELQTTMMKLEGKLYTALKNLNIGSNDTMGDLIAHIIGMGKKEFEAVIKDPQLAYQRYQSGQYTESFSYALPHKSDYKNLNVTKFTDWAQEVIGNYTMILNASEDDIPWKSKLAAPLKKVISIMEKFVETKDVATFLDNEAEAKKESEEVGKILSRLQLGWSIPKEGSLESAVHFSGNKWGVWNLFTDVRDYLS